MVRSTTCLLLAAAACSSSSQQVDGFPPDLDAPAYACPQTIAQLQAAPPPDGIDYISDFTTASMMCHAGLAETFGTCTPYNQITAAPPADCFSARYYTQASGALLAVMKRPRVGDGSCAAATMTCMAGPPRLVFDFPQICTYVVGCQP